MSIFKVYLHSFITLTLAAGSEEEAKAIAEANTPGFEAEEIEGPWETVEQADAQDPK